LRANVARIDLPLADDAEPRVAALPPFPPDTWYEEDGKRSRGPAGEYFPAIVLSDGGLGVVSAIKNEEANRLGFSWRRTVREPGR
jgi:hypothetical protein